MREAQRLGGVVIDPLADVAGLGVGEGAARAKWPARAATGEGLQALGAIGRPPAADGLVGDAQEVGEVQLGVAQLDAPQGAQPQHLESFVGQLAGVG